MNPKEANHSIWADVAPPPAASNVALPTSVDACVIGAGIAGLSIAYQLAEAGKSVLVIDDGPIGRGQTEQTTAHLSSVIDDRFSEVERIHGVEAVRLAHESHGAAIRRIGEIAAREQIDCDYARVDGYLVPAGADHVRIIEQEDDSLRRAGVTDYERLDYTPIQGLGPGPCLKFHDQAQFHPLKYLNGLARAIERKGGRVVTGRHVASVRGGSPAEVAVEGETDPIKAGAVAVATNSPIHLNVAIHTKQAPYMSYVVGFAIPSGGVERALYWDTIDPYHYVRTQPIDAEHDLLIVGGEDHKTGHKTDPAERFRALEEWTRAHFPAAVGAPVTHHWCGQVQETIDGLAFLGRCPAGTANVYIATGDSGMGMTHGTLAGLVVGDLILGRDNPWTTLYDPSRKPPRTLKDYLSENLDVAVKYGELLTPGEVSSVDEIAPGSGAVLRRGLTKVVAFRDDSGVVTEMSAICPHLHCVVHFNPVARSWDCPCHGSRFDAHGDVIVGPANKGLEKLS